MQQMYITHLHLFRYNYLQKGKRDCAQIFNVWKVWYLNKEENIMANPTTQTQKLPAVQKYAKSEAKRS